MKNAYSPTIKGTNDPVIKFSRAGVKRAGEKWHERSLER